MSELLLQKIVSGGQTGVDRAALDAALAYKLSVGGWCPKGRLAEDGRIPLQYPLQEAASKDYRVRTKLNVEASDATLIISAEPLIGGTQLTATYANELNRPLYILNCTKVAKSEFANIEHWLRSNRVRVLNIAGPRQSQERGIYQQTYTIICDLLHYLFY